MSLCGRVRVCGCPFIDDKLVPIEHGRMLLNSLGLGLLKHQLTIIMVESSVLLNVIEEIANCHLNLRLG